MSRPYYDISPSVWVVAYIHNNILRASPHVDHPLMSLRSPPGCGGGHDMKLVINL